jgi:ferrous iron transport protein A
MVCSSQITDQHATFDLNRNGIMLTFMVTINLLEVPVGATVRIHGVEGGELLAARLRQYGLFPGDQARLLRVAPFAGPVLLEVNGREIALGRGIAALVRVEAL